MTNIFVTGGSGFIGSHLCKKLSEQNNVVTLMRDLPPPKTPWGEWLAEALKNVTVVFGDILSIKLIRRVLTEYRIDCVYHLAAQAIVSTALKDPIGTYETNIMGTLNILEASKQIDMRKLLYLSTDKVFSETLAADANSPILPSGPYETSKACADLICQSWLKTYGKPEIVIPRLCNVYGYDLSPRIIPNVIRQCLRHQDPIIYKGEKSIRQYIYIDDAVDALIHLMNGDYTGCYNIATNDILKQEEVVLTILENFRHLRPKYVEREKPIKEIKQQSMILTPCDWEPKTTFRKGIKATIKAFRRWGWS